MLHQLAPAKLNLMLHVTGKQSSGYHELQSLFTFVPSIHDYLEISQGDSLSLEIIGPFAQDLLPPYTSNTIIKAANWLQRKLSCSKGTLIRLTKDLPIASGIGGGSSDGAAAIAGFLTLWDISLSIQEKWDLVLASGELGADVPVCLAYQFGFGTAFWIEGSGKDTLPVPVEDKSTAFYVLVNPNSPVSTADVFRLTVPPYSRPVSPPSQVSFEFVVSHQNDLTFLASQVCPAITSVLEALEKTPECLLARLSGTGATCFGLFETQAAAQQAASLLHQKYPSWWIQSQ